MKTVKVTSAFPYYLAAAVWIAFGLIVPLYSLGSIILCAGISIAAYLAGGLIFKGRTIDVEMPPDTGDAELNRQITEGRRNLASLKSLGGDISSEAVSGQLARMEAAGMKIFAEIERNTAKANQVRKFMSYYLPTSVKLLNHYHTLMNVGGSGEHIGQSMESIERSLMMIAVAFEKQLDNLYRADALDITTDIQVLETMMAAEGLAGDTLTNQSPQGGV